jgi:RHS repeat-associated protein
MPIPGRNGIAFQSTWVPGRGFVAGSTYPDYLQVASRPYAPTPDAYRAGKEVELLPGFETATGTDELLVEIQAGSGVLSNDYPGGEGNYESYGYYRYGFNGKENDNEVKGSGNQQDYGMRIYDPRLGRFLSVDPITNDYPWYTPYQFAGNKPIAFIDLDGLEEARKGIIKKADDYLEAYHPIQAGIQNGFYDFASYTGVNLVDDLLQEIAWGAKGQQSWSEVGKGLINTFFKTTAPYGVPIPGPSPAAKIPPAPSFALSVEKGVVTVASPPRPLLINPNTTLVMASSSQTPTESKSTKPQSADHHIATNKNNISSARGGPWTPRFMPFFEKAGLDINKGSENIVNVLNHSGPHPKEYHQLVFDRLTLATQGLKEKTTAYKSAVTNTLQAIGAEAQQAGSPVNKLLTKKP